MNDTQKACPHVFIGRTDGVHCTRCGLHLTAKQYHELLHPPEKAEPDNSAKPMAENDTQTQPSEGAQGTFDDADNKEPAEGEKAEQAATEPPQEKPKRTHKKKGGDRQ